ncbi:MAG: class I SAM-dependent methyltransferase [Planctomycetota bacterium]|jgi:ubiquinone/menaquinone biosynthesis C-methylase UbiE
MSPEKSREIALTQDQVQEALITFDRRIREKGVDRKTAVAKYFELQARLAAFGEGESNHAYPMEDTKRLPIGVHRYTTGKQHVVPFADIKRNDAVLDLGCGIGADVYFAAEATGPLGRVLGVDICGFLIDRGQRWAADKGMRNVKFIHCPAEDLPLSDRIIDVAIVNHSFYLMDQERIIEQLARVVKRMGRVIIADVFPQTGNRSSISSFEKQASGWIHFAAGAKPFEVYPEIAKKYGFHSCRFVRSSGVDDSYGCMIIERMPP